MISICAQVPMSHLARTSVPDLWSENKVIKKEWIWVTNGADWDYWMASYICLWFVCCLARQSSVVTLFWQSCVWGRPVPRVCCVFRFLTTSSDSVGHALAATVVYLQ